MKRILVVLIILASFFLLNTKVRASDLTVTCADNGPCDIVPSDRLLFSVNKFLPGQSRTQKITVENQDSDDDCSLYLDVYNPKDPDNFSEKIFTVIKDGDSDLFGKRAPDQTAMPDKTLNDLYNNGNIYLSSIDKGETKEFVWTITFDPQTGNEFQAKITQFDFDLVFSCGIVPSSTPIPTATPVSSSTSSSSTTSTSDSTTGTSASSDTTANSTPVVGGGFVPLVFAPVTGVIAGDILTGYTVIPGSILGVQVPPGYTVPVGGSTCYLPWWWYLVFVVQMILSLIMAKRSKKENLEVVVGSVFLFFSAALYVGLKYFCIHPLIVAWTATGILSIGLYKIKNSLRKLVIKQLMFN